jgi:hypothetical protein
MIRGKVERWSSVEEEGNQDVGVWQRREAGRTSGWGSGSRRGGVDRELSVSKVKEVKGNVPVEHISPSLSLSLPLPPFLPHSLTLPHFLPPSLLPPTPLLKDYIYLYIYVYYSYIYIYI